MGCSGARRDEQAAKCTVIIGVLATTNSPSRRWREQLKIEAAVKLAVVDILGLQSTERKPRFDEIRGPARLISQAAAVAADAAQADRSDR